MPEPTPPTAPAKKKRATPHDISRETEDDIALADQCAQAAAPIGIMALLTPRGWTDQEQSRLRGAVEQANTLVRQLRGLRSAKKTRTREEETARTELLTALDPILAGAKRTYPGDGDPNRALFGVGQNLVNESTSRLYRLTGETHQRLTATGNKPPEFTLKGVTPAEIAALAALTKKYKDADFAQATALLNAADVLDQLNTHVTDIMNPLRRDLQLTADQQWSYRNKDNRAKRLAFAIPADRPAGE